MKLGASPADGSVVKLWAPVYSNIKKCHDIGFGEPGESFRVHIGAFEKLLALRFRVRWLKREERLGHGAKFPQSKERFESPKAANQNRSH